MVFFKKAHGESICALLSDTATMLTIFDIFMRLDHPVGLSHKASTILLQSRAYQGMKRREPYRQHPNRSMNPEQQNNSKA
eukprot:4230119-Amphidinium_carterae.1